VQLVELIWFSSGCSLPAGHGVGAAAPGVAQYAPVGQGAHAAADTDPDAELNEPACGHNVTTKETDGATLVTARTVNVEARRTAAAALRAVRRLACATQLARRLPHHILILPSSALLARQGIRAGRESARRAGTAVARASRRKSACASADNNTAVKANGREHAGSKTA